MIKVRNIWHNPHVQTWGIPFAIFLAAFLAIAVYPVSRPIVWSDRAYHFWLALQEGDWATTFQRYHPGVTIMWLAGAGLHLFAWYHGGFSPDQMLGIAPTKPGTLTASVEAAIIPVAFVIALCIALLYPLLSKLMDRRVAFASVIFLTFDSYFISTSKVIHPDALLAIFMLVTAVTSMIYLTQEKTRYLLLSGLFAGLSVLSKSPSLFLFPYIAMIYTLWRLRVWRWEPDKWHGWGLELWHAVKAGLAWFAVAAVLFVALWPAMWVRPQAVLTRMAEKILFHTEEVHQNPVFFNGVSNFDDPGLLFYVATIAWKLTLISLPLVLLALVVSFLRRRELRSWLVWMLALYVAFFTLQMGMSSWKQMAYVLPVFPALAVLAGIGLVWLAEWVQSRWQTKAAVGITAVILLIQIALTLAYHPYYGTHHNLLLGGTRVAQNILPLQENGEGLDLAGQYLSQLPHNQDKTAMIHPRSGVVFQREFEGRTITDVIPWANYRVYYVNQVMRGLNNDDGWGEWWEKDSQTEPLHVVEFGGIPYVWIYGQAPEAPVVDGVSLPADYQIGEHISLASAQLATDEVAAGDEIVLQLDWLSDGDVGQDLTVFTHVTNEAGDLVAQFDRVPLYGIRPTTTWRESEQLEDLFFIQIDETTPPGRYDLWVGMYDSATIERQPAYEVGRDTPLPDQRIPLATLTILPPDTPSD